MDLYPDREGEEILLMHENGLYGLVFKPPDIDW
jgi:hypothetical protein